MSTIYSHRLTQIAPLVAMGITLLCGCSREPTAKQDKPQPVAAQQESSQPPAAVSDSTKGTADETPSAASEPAQPVHQEPAPPVGSGVLAESTKPSGAVEIPKVTMAEIDRAKCKIFVGDSIPLEELPDLAGQTRPMQSLLADHGALLVFFNVAQDRYSQLLATNLLSDLDRDVVQKYGHQAVAVVAIHVGKPSPELEKVVKDAGVTFPILLDAEGRYFAQFTADTPPTLYLVDHAGKVLWLDIEYSRAARESLKQALEAITQKR